MFMEKQLEAPPARVAENLNAALLWLYMRNSRVVDFTETRTVSIEMVSCDRNSAWPGSVLNSSSVLQLVRATIAIASRRPMYLVKRFMLQK